MDDVRKVIVVLIGVVATIAVNILVMMNGWGLDPKSWWWIIGGGVGLRLLTEAIVIIGKAE